jgi:hypothetical protein
MNKAILMIVIMVISGCASIEGTKNKSFTSNKSFATQNITSLAVLPVKEDAALPGLSTQIENELYKNICAKLPYTKVIDPMTFGSRLATKDLITEFGKWKAGYEASSFIDSRPLAMFSQATDARYFLLVHSTHLSREKIRAVDTGYSGWVSDAKNVWRTDLKVSAELIDAKSGMVVWKGFGYAENVNSPRKDIDLGIVIVHQRNPEVNSFAPEMVQVVAEGIASQIATIAASTASTTPPIYKEEPPKDSLTPNRGFSNERKSTGSAPIEEKITEELPPSKVLINPDTGAVMNNRPGDKQAGFVEIEKLPSVGIKLPKSNNAENGIIIEGVYPGSPAAKAGLKAGDKIVEKNGQPVKILSELKSQRRQKMGDIVEYKIIRGGREMVFSMKTVPFADIVEAK